MTEHFEAEQSVRGGASHSRCHRQKDSTCLAGRSTCPASQHSVRGYGWSSTDPGDLAGCYRGWCCIGRQAHALTMSRWAGWSGSGDG